MPVTPTGYHSQSILPRSIRSYFRENPGSNPFEVIVAIGQGKALSHPLGVGPVPKPILFDLVVLGITGITHLDEVICLLLREVEIIVLAD